MSKQSYIEKLKDPRWQKKRLEVFQRDQWMCVKCLNKSQTLNVHHKTYLPNTEPWEYPLDYLVTFCERCHSEEFMYIEVIISMFPHVFRKNFTSVDLFRFYESLRSIPNSPIAPSTVMRALAWHLQNNREVLVETYLKSLKDDTINAKTA